MIWLIGCEGMLGRELAEVFDAAGMAWVGSDREVDIRSPEALAAFAESRDIGWIVNCAAYTAVDKAEDEGELARALNAEAPGNIARLAAELGASMIHLSTDYVFDGSATSPYAEDAPLSPLGAYGRTKAEGEAAARAACANLYIVRTAWLYGRHGPNFVKTMLRLMSERDFIRVVFDQRGSPTWARDLAAAILALVRSPCPEYGVYHFTNEGETSWYEFALAIRDEARASGLLPKDCRVDPIAASEYPSRTRRPAYSVLSKARIRESFGIEPPPWRDSLHEYFLSIGEEA